MNFAYRGLKKMSDERMMEDLSSAHTIAVDIETISLKDTTPIGIGIATSPADSYYFPVDSAYIEDVLHFIQNPAKLKVYHNAMFDMAAIAEEWGIISEHNMDTMLLCRHCNLPLQLQQASFMFGRYDVTLASEMCKGGKTMLDAPIDKVAEHCCIDAQATLTIWEELKDRYEATYQPYLLDMALLPILIKMQLIGIEVDQFVRGEIEEQLTWDVQHYRNICDGFGFNPGSPMQVGFTLANRNNILPLRKSKKTGKLSYDTRDEILLPLADPLAQIVLLYRRSSKLLSTYIKPLSGQERAYSHYHMSTVTGRLGSARLNMQNIPEKLRAMFVGPFTDIDWNQIELRVLAHESNDKKMLEIFADPNGDIHNATMVEIGATDRRVAKGINYGISYGETDVGLMKYCQKEGVNIDYYTAAEFRKKWFNTFTGAADWIISTQETAANTYHTTTPMGRKIFIEEFLSYEYGVQEQAKRYAINYPIQGGAAELVKMGMVMCQHLLMVLQAHDELLFTGKVKLPAGLDYLNGIHVPYKVKYVETWGG